MSDSAHSFSNRAALRRWRALSPADQYAVAARLLQAWGDRLREAHKVVGVGVGYRLKRPKPGAQRPHAAGAGPPRLRSLGTVRRRELCLRFVVRRKWRSDAPDRASAVPRYITATVRHKGRSIRVAIPTDVEQLRKGRLHAASDLTDGVRVVDARNSGNAAQGSICCTVVETGAPERLYLLSCHHVLTLSGNSDLLTPVARTFVNDVSTERRIGELASAAILGDGNRFGLDAAIARFVDPEPSRCWGIRPTGIVGPTEKPERLMVMARRRSSAGPRSGPLPAGFLDVQFGLRLEVRPGVFLLTERVLRCIASTKPGDSGSALLARGGRLAGMHFFLDTEGRSCAIAADLLFRPNVFSVPITLPR